MTAPFRTAAAALVVTGATMMTATAAQACGMEPYLGEICFFAGAVCPDNYEQAAGQVIQVNERTNVLYSVIENIYGGVPGKTFALPNLTNRLIVGANRKPDVNGQPAYPALGTTRGEEYVHVAAQDAPSGHTGSASAGTTRSLPTVHPQIALTACIAVKGNYPVRNR